MNVGSWKFVMALSIVSLLLSVGAAAQLREERPNYPDEIVPLGGRSSKVTIRKMFIV